MTVAWTKDEVVFKAFLDVYNPKYGLRFDDLLPPCVIEPDVVLTWDTLNDAGIGGFRAVGKWTFGSGDDSSMKP